MTMRLIVNGNDFGECMTCDFDFAECRARITTTRETLGKSADVHEGAKADRLARSIADEAALSLIDSCSTTVDRQGVEWHQIAPDYWSKVIEGRLEYLKLRALVETDADDARLVRFLRRPPKL